jgi:hypothetical protein
MSLLWLKYFVNLCGFWRSFRFGSQWCESLIKCYLFLFFSLFWHIIRLWIFDFFLLFFFFLYFFTTFGIAWFVWLFIDTLIVGIGFNNILIFCINYCIIFLNFLIFELFDFFKSQIFYLIDFYDTLFFSIQFGTYLGLLILINNLLLLRFLPFIIIAPKVHNMSHLVLFNISNTISITLRNLLLRLFDAQKQFL